MLVQTLTKNKILSSEKIQTERADLIRFRATLENNRYAYFSKTILEVSERIQQGEEISVVFTSFNPHSTNYVDMALNYVLPDTPNVHIKVLVVNHDNPTVKTYCSIPVIGYKEFMENLSQYKGAVLLDQLLHDVVRNPLEKIYTEAGLLYCRVEQFMNAPFVRHPLLQPYAEAYIQNFEQTLAVETVYADEFSVLGHYANLKAVMALNFSFFGPYVSPNSERYLPPDIGFKYCEQEIYIDGGAYNGDESIRFASKMKGHFEAIHTFEPDRENFKKVSHNVNQYFMSLPKEANPNMYLHPLGIWDKNAYLSFTGQDMTIVVQEAPAGAIGPGIHVVRLDDYIEKATSIKLEIEAAEKQALHGATRLIQENKPKLAIAVYHLPNDYITLSEIIQNFDLGYDIYLRHHSLDHGLMCFYCTPPAN